MRRRAALVVVLATGFVLLSAGALGLRWAFGYPDRLLPGPGASKEIVVDRGATFGVVLRKLREAGVVRRPFLFRLFANSSGLASRIRPGRYTVRPGLTPRTLLKMLVRGPKIVLRKVTIPEGKNMLQVAHLMAQTGICDEQALLAKMRSRAFAQSLGIPAGSVEGYLFPDTYRFRVGSSPDLVIRTLVERFRQVLSDLKARHPSYLIRLRNRYRYDDHQLVILASLVEKETADPHERPLIAGVFLNRLHSPRFPSRRLETDPTIIYGCTVPVRRSPACLQFRGRIRRIHLRDAENPYNTYQHPGLPPGPIANPGRAALLAVLRPAQTRYLYFVSKNNGTHHFSSTIEEHRRMVDRYQRHGRRPRSRPR